MTGVPDRGEGKKLSAHDRAVVSRAKQLCKDASEDRTGVMPWEVRRLILLIEKLAGEAVA